MDNNFNEILGSLENLREDHSEFMPLGSKKKPTTQFNDYVARKSKPKVTPIEVIESKSKSVIDLDPSEQAAFLARVRNLSQGRKRSLSDRDLVLLHAGAGQSA